MTDAADNTAELAGQDSAEQAQLAADSSTDQAAVTTEQPEERQEPRQQPPAWAQKRIDQVTREKYEARREADAARQEAETYRRLLEAQQGGEPSTLPQSQQPAQDPREIAQQIVQQEKFNEACNRVFEQGKAEFGDFEDSLKNLTYLGQIPPDFLAAVIELEKPHAVLHAMASDLDAAARILALPPVQQGRELERLALKAAAPKPQPVSKAPAPVTPVDGSVNAAPDPEGMSMSDWVKWREQNRQRK